MSPTVQDPDHNLEDASVPLSLRALSALALDSLHDHGRNSMKIHTTISTMVASYVLIILRRVLPPVKDSETCTKCVQCVSYRYYLDPFVHDTALIHLLLLL